jgi:hypothetical protein
MNNIDNNSKNGRYFYDFNHKNIAFIVGTLLVLSVFLLVQGRLFKSASTIGLTLGQEHSVFSTASNTKEVADAGQQSAVLGASTLSPDIESQMSSLAIVKDSLDTVSAGQAYAQQVIVVENADKSNPSKLANDLISIAVPASLADYQRMVIVRAQLQSQLLFATASDQTQNLQDEISAISQQIIDAQSNFAPQGINLPA